jgi:hypothetical protein
MNHAGGLGGKPLVYGGIQAAIWVTDIAGKHLNP